MSVTVESVPRTAMSVSEHYAASDRSIAGQHSGLRKQIQIPAAPERFLEQTVSNALSHGLLSHEEEYHTRSGSAPHNKHRKEFKGDPENEPTTRYTLKLQGTHQIHEAAGTRSPGPYTRDLESRTIL